MLSKVRVSKGLLSTATKSFSTTTSRDTKVTVLGASGGIGQPLSLLLKSNPHVTELALYDVLHSPGVAADLAHISNACKVTGYGPGELEKALTGSEVVICAAGVPRQAGQTREDQFNVNSRIVKDLAVSCARFLPNAIYGIITNPINSTVPLFCDVFQKAGVLNEKKIMGITNLGAVRTNSFIAKEKGWDPAKIYCPVIGGHSGMTIVPVLSQCKPACDLPSERQKLLILRVREAGVEIVEAKVQSGKTVTLSMAWSAAKFTDSVLRALEGEKGVVECAYVKSNVSKTRYFSNPIELGPSGVEKNLGIPTLSKYEQDLLAECIPLLTQHIEAGEAFAARPN